MRALEQLGAFVAASKHDSIALRELVRLHVVDTVGAWIAGAHTREGRAIIKLRSSQRSGGRAPLLQDPFVDLMTHCALARLSEIDSIHLTSMVTPGSIVIPGAYVIAGSIPDLTSELLIDAIIVGCDAITRLGLAINGPTVLFRGVWPTYFAAPFGIAAVSSRLLKLNERQTTHALALALTLASPGVGHDNAASTSRWLAIGNAARNGLSAALAAQAGFTADLGLLDGSFLSAIYQITPQPKALTDDLGARAMISEVSFKPWCAARQTMAGTQGLLQIIENGVSVDDIIAIMVEVPPPHLKMVSHGIVQRDRASHLTSLPYQMAIAARAKDCLFDVQQCRKVVSQSINAFMAKITVQAGQELMVEYPRIWPARVHVTTRSGSQERVVRNVPGDVQFPFDEGRVTRKFLKFIEPQLGTETATQLLACSLAAVNDMESVRRLMLQIEGIISSASERAAFSS